jgi:arylsulfatase A-like enzyme
MAAACHRAEPPRFTVAHRLLEHVEAPRFHDADVSCSLGDEHRPGFGCTSNRVVLNTRFPDAGANWIRTKQVGFARARGPASYAVWARVSMPGAGAEWEVLPAQVRAGRGRGATVALAELGVVPAKKATKVQVFSRALGPLVTRTTPLSVSREAVLTFGIGLDPVARADDVAAVEFIVTARTETKEQELFRTTIEPASPAAATWHDQSVPLADVSGGPMSLTFTARVVPKDDASSDRTRLTALPPWGAPVILEPSPQDRRPNVLLVSLDTLRADHVGVYGSRFPTSPHLDELAAGGVVFEHAVTTYPSTTASHMSMLTGLYPARHGVRGPTNRLTDGVPSLASLLGGAGWRTAAVTENGMVAAAAGFPRGFSFYRENTEVADEHAMRAVEVTMDMALGWLERHARERFFLFVHTYQVHWPYRPPPEFDLFDSWHDGERVRPIADAPKLVRLNHRYAGEVRYADSQLARLLAALARLGLDDDTIVIVTADHGDEFGEHGGWSHNHSVYQELLRVPLVMWAPGVIPGGRRVRAPVSVVDLPPTILELVGVPIPPGLDGESQVARFGDERENPERVVFAEVWRKPADGGRLIAAQTSTAKWIYGEQEGRIVEAYDLGNDPGEQHPVDDPGFLARGLAAVAPYRSVRERGGTKPSGPVPHIDPKTERNLRALGYLD